MPFGQPNSATTLSINFSPGQEKRLLNSKSEAIFTFGDFTIEKDFSSTSLTGFSKNLSFGGFSTLQSLNADGFTYDYTKTDFIQQNELNLPKKDPKSHSYFSSFYTNVASSINNIIKNYPYAILSYNNGGATIFDYVEYFNNTTQETSSSFKIPVAGLVNQSGIILTSGNTDGVLSLPYDYAKFCIQISGNTNVFKISGKKVKPFEKAPL